MKISYTVGFNFDQNPLDWITVQKFEKEVCQACSLLTTWSHGAFLNWMYVLTKTDTIRDPKH